MRHPRQNTARDAEDAVEWISHATGVRPEGAVVFGSGWAPVAERIEHTRVFRYSDIPGFRATTTPGHPGKLVVGEWRGVPCIAFVGRWHLYEGYDSDAVLLPARVAAGLGCRWLLSTNAAGGIDRRLRIGSLVVVADDVALFAPYPITLPEEIVRGPVYAPWIVEGLSQAAVETNVQMEPGTLGLMLGPNYETAAEIRMLAAAGVSVVSMSTVPEAREACALGLSAGALSCVTNMTPAIPEAPISHAEVLEVLNTTRGAATTVLERWIEHYSSRAR